MRATLIHGKHDVRVSDVPDPTLRDDTDAIVRVVRSCTAIEITRDGGMVGRVGVSQYTDVPMGVASFMRNVGINGDVAPARAYIEELLPDVMEGRIQPGKVFDRTVGLDEVPDSYRAMNEREALKVLVRP